MELRAILEEKISRSSIKADIQISLPIITGNLIEEIRNAARESKKRKSISSQEDLEYGSTAFSEYIGSSTDSNEPGKELTKWEIFCIW